MHNGQAEALRFRPQLGLSPNTPTKSPSQGLRGPVPDPDGHFLPHGNFNPQQDAPQDSRQQTDRTQCLYSTMEAESVETTLGYSLEEKSFPPQAPTLTLTESQGKREFVGDIAIDVLATAYIFTDNETGRDPGQGTNARARMGGGDNTSTQCGTPKIAAYVSSPKHSRESTVNVWVDEHILQEGGLKDFSPHPAPGATEKARTPGPSLGDFPESVGEAGIAEETVARAEEPAIKKADEKIGDTKATKKVTLPIHFSKRLWLTLLTMSHKQTAKDLDWKEVAVKPGDQGRMTKSKSGGEPGDAQPRMKEAKQSGRPTKTTNNSGQVLSSKSSQNKVGKAPRARLPISKSATNLGSRSEGEGTTSVRIGDFRTLHIEVRVMDPAPCRQNATRVPPNGSGQGQDDGSSNEPPKCRQVAAKRPGQGRGDESRNMPPKMPQCRQRVRSRSGRQVKERAAKMPPRCR